MKTSLAIDSILSARFLREGEKTFEDICRRVAWAVADNDEEAMTFYDIMVSLRFLPNSPTLMNAGTEIGQLSACFVLPVEDSINGIFDAMKNGAIIHKTGGGTGYNFSQIRPKGSRVQSTDGVASGPVSFMGIFNAATEVIRQGGRRRGANMGILNVWHPDILSFLSAKAREGDIANFNISVMANDKFMDLVSREMYDKVWIIHPSSGESITVGQIWSAIIGGIWRNGEPGILFFDEINRCNPLPDLGVIDTTNPCGEQPLLPYESCVLGSINLSVCIHNGILDEHILNNAVRTAVRFLDKVIDKNIYPISKIEEATKKTRKVGLGLMGVHDALLMIGLAYDSAEGRTWCEDVMRNVTETAVDESRSLAEQFGAFPLWKVSIWQGVPMRNAALTSIAPTGTLSLLARCSSGIEPVFSFAYTRRNTVGKTFVIVNPIFRESLKKTIMSMDLTKEERVKRINDVLTHVHEMGTIQDLHWLPDEFRSLFKTALDIHWKDHILMQAAFQKHVHASISKTINLPNTASKEDCANAILMAWKLKLKGITMYRTGSRQNVVLSLKDTSSVAYENNLDNTCSLNSI
jgi:ribonucleoside-diphosphate reductase alpha chain